VLAEVSRRLTGTSPAPGFLDELRRRFDGDPFTRHVVLEVIAEVAFAGRIPQTRPAGVSWDRGLTWWAALLAGTTPAAFDASLPGTGVQRPLFGAEPARSDDAGRAPQRPDAAGDARVRWLPRPDAGAEPAAGPAAGAVAGQRRALAAELRALLRAGNGRTVPADAVERLLAELTDDPP